MTVSGAREAAELDRPRRRSGSAFFSATGAQAAVVYRAGALQLLAACAPIVVAYARFSPAPGCSAAAPSVGCGVDQYASRDGCRVGEVRPRAGSSPNQHQRVGPGTSPAATPKPSAPRGRCRQSAMIPLGRQHSPVVERAVIRQCVSAAAQTAACEDRRDPEVELDVRERRCRRQRA